MGEVFAHVADANFMICGMVQRRQADHVGIEKTKKTKADLMAALAESFTFCEEAYAALTDANSGATVEVLPARHPHELGVLAVQQHPSVRALRQHRHLHADEGDGAAVERRRNVTRSGIRRNARTSLTKRARGAPAERSGDRGRPSARSGRPAMSKGASDGDGGSGGRSPPVKAWGGGRRVRHLTRRNRLLALRRRRGLRPLGLPVEHDHREQHVKGQPGHEADDGGLKHAEPGRRAGNRWLIAKSVSHDSPPVSAADRPGAARRTAAGCLE